MAKGKPSKETFSIKSLLNCPVIRRHAEMWLEAMECAHRQAVTQKRRQSKLNSKAIKSAPQVTKVEQQSMDNIRAGKLQTYINEKVLPAYWSTESIRQRATKHAEKLNITDANEIDNIVRAMTEDKDEHLQIHARTAQRWLNILGYTYRKNGKNGQFIDYNQRQVLFELRSFYPFHVAEESCILCC